MAAKKSPVLLGATKSGRPVLAPTRKAPNSDDINVFLKLKREYAGWTKADHMDANEILEHAGHARWGGIHWDLGGKWSAPEQDAYIVRRGPL